MISKKGFRTSLQSEGILTLKHLKHKISEKNRKKTVQDKNAGFKKGRKKRHPIQNLTVTKPGKNKNKKEKKRKEKMAEGF